MYVVIWCYDSYQRLQSKPIKSEVLSWEKIHNIREAWKENAQQALLPEWIAVPATHHHWLFWNWKKKKKTISWQWVNPNSSSVSRICVCISSDYGWGDGMSCPSLYIAKEMSWHLARYVTWCSTKKTSERKLLRALKWESWCDWVERETYVERNCGRHKWEQVPASSKQ